MSEPATPAAPAAAGNNKMMFIMMGVMLVVLLGGMGGMYMMLGKKSVDAEHSEKAGEKADGEKAKDEKEPEKKTAAIYVGFEPPFVVNFPLDSTVKFLQLTVQIMTRAQTVEHEIKANDPAIRHALLTLFGQQASEKLATPEGRETLRLEALEAVRGVIKSEGGEAEKVEAVYFTTFVMQ